MKTKYLVNIEFRYSIKPKNEDDETKYIDKTIAVGVFNTQEEAIKEGNKTLEVLEKYFKLNPNYNRKERFSKNGGSFNSFRNLITNLGYLQTPFSFYAKIETLYYNDVEETVINILKELE